MGFSTIFFPHRFVCCSLEFGTDPASVFSIFFVSHVVTLEKKIKLWRNVEKLNLIYERKRYFAAMFGYDIRAMCKN